MDQDPAATPSQPTDGNVQNDTTRADSYGHVLVCGLITGFVIGIFNALAAENGWKIERYFDNLDAPLIRLLLRLIRYKEQIWIPAWIASYWTAIGLLVTSFICVVRMLVKGKAARGSRVSEE